MAVLVAPRGTPEPESTSTEVDTGVSTYDIKELMDAAHYVEWERAPRRLMLEWMEEAATLFELLLGEPAREPFEGALNAEN